MPLRNEPAPPWWTIQDPGGFPPGWFPLAPSEGRLKIDRLVPRWIDPHWSERPHP